MSMCDANCMRNWSLISDYFHDVLMMTDSVEGCWSELRGTGRPTTGREMCTNVWWGRRETQSAVK